jgi:hypothetical protein
MIRGILIIRYIAGKGLRTVEKWYRIKRYLCLGRAPVNCTLLRSDIQGIQ